jgi:hypothetical protein
MLRIFDNSRFKTKKSITNFVFAAEKYLEH